MEKNKYRKNLNQIPDFISKQVYQSDYFFLDLNPDPKSSYSITCGGLEHCTKNYVVERRRFEFYGLEYVASGHCKLLLENSEYDLKAGSVFWYGPKTQHRMENVGNISLIKYFVDFTGQELSHFFTESFPLGPQAYQMPNIRIMSDLFHQLLEAGKRGGKYVQEILYLVIRLVAVQVKQNAVDLNAYHSQSYATFERCFSYLERHFKELTSVSQLARACHISPGYLSRGFKRYLGESTSDCILRLKMNHASELLLQENLLIKEVADRVSIEDAYHFSRLFKRYFGLSPKHFREFHTHKRQGTEVKS